MSAAPGAAGASPTATVRLAREGETSDLARALEFEAVRQDACFHAPDFAEGVAAFLGKRAPRFG